MLTESWVYSDLFRWILMARKMQLAKGKLSIWWQQEALRYCLEILMDREHIHGVLKFLRPIFSWYTTHHWNLQKYYLTEIWSHTVYNWVHRGTVKWYNLLIRSLKNKGTCIIHTLKYEKYYQTLPRRPILVIVMVILKRCRPISLLSSALYSQSHDITWWH